MKLVVTILSGGAGSRLWPISRENYPKPFIKLPDNESLLQKALLRGAHIPSVVEILTVTNRDLLFLTINDFEAIKHKGIPKKFILEPVGRNTAPAIIAACLETISNHGEDAYMLILPADHIVQDQIAFEEAVKEALSLAGQNKLVTFGIKPGKPDTSYGYIEAEGSAVKRFIEKPNLENATTYFDQGNFYWNAGMFCFKAKTFLQEIKKYAEPMLNEVLNTIHHSRRENESEFPRLFLDSKSFEKIIPDSIDYALFEKSSNVAVVPCEIGWSDVGSWTALTDLMDHDDMGNRIQGNALLHLTKNSSVYGQNRMIGLIGVDNLIVAETDDAVLVVDKAHAQEVKFLYQKLKADKNDLYQWHKEVHRPWGSYTVLCEGERFKVKRIFVKAHHELSLQRHRHRAEHWVVVKGEAAVINNDQKIILKENESIYIPKGNAHQLINQKDSILEIIEVQSGDYVGEDDIERIHDKYKR
jgi:mannose-1-phosphate guanylyltransferase/mannose-6-phosphate isomerase